VVRYAGSNWRRLPDSWPVARSDDAWRTRTPPDERDRSRACDTIHRYGADGLLTRRETEDRIEQVFRAKTLAALDAVIAQLPHAPHIKVDVVTTHGLESIYGLPRPKQRPWWHGIVMWSSFVSVVWIVVWLATGPTHSTLGIPNTIWLVVTLLGTWLIFSIRFVSRHRRVLQGKSPTRRRLV
jgi:Domain of unknown function (DUF1707)